MLFHAIAGETDLCPNGRQNTHYHTCHTDTHMLAHRSLERVQRGPHYDRCFRVAGARPLEWDMVTFLHFLSLSLSLSLSESLTVKSCKQLLAESSHVVCVCVCVCGFVWETESNTVAASQLALLMCKKSGVQLPLRLILKCVLPLLAHIKSTCLMHANILYIYIIHITSVNISKTGHGKCLWCLSSWAVIQNIHKYLAFNGG